MTAPLPLPIAPFAIMAGDPAPAGKAGPGEGNDSLAGESLAGLAFGPLLQQILLTPAGQILPGQAAEDGDGRSLSLLASAPASPASLIGGSLLRGENREPILGLLAATGNASSPEDAPAMRLVATLPELARAAFGADALASSSPMAPLAMAMATAAARTPARDGAGALAGQPGAMASRPSSISPVVVTALATKPDAGAAPTVIGGPELVGEGSAGAGKMTPPLSALPSEQPEGAPAQAASVAPQDADAAPSRAAGREAGQTVGGRAARTRPEKALPPAAAPADREGRRTAQSVGDGPNAKPAAAVLAERLTRQDDRLHLSQVEQTRVASPPGASAISVSPGEAGIGNLMQPAEAGLRLAFSAEERAQATQMRAKMRAKVTASRTRPAAAAVPPSPSLRPEPIGATGVRQDGRASFMEAPAGSAGRGPTSPAATSHPQAFSLPTSGPGGERIHAEATTPAGQLPSAPSQPTAANHPAIPAHALSQPSHGTGLPHHILPSSGDGLAPSSENPTAAPFPPAGHGSADGPARSLASLQQPVPGQQQPHAATQLGLALQYRIGRQETKFTLRLDPPELGRVEVSLKLHEGGRVDALIRTEHGHTLDLLQRDVRILERAFHQLGLKPEGGIQFASGQQGQGHTGSSFSQAQQDGMGQSHAGGGQDDSGGERQASETARHAAGLESPETTAFDDAPRDRPLMAATVGLDVKV